MHPIKERRHLQGTGFGAALVAVIAGAVLSGSCLFDTATTLCEANGVRCGPGQVCSADQKTCIAIGGCGDGIINAEKKEVCDDGNTVDRDGCSQDCKSDETCGNGLTDASVGETCDDGNTTSDDGCSANCKLEACGDGFFNPGEDCDTAGDTQACNGNGLCSIPACGDGYINIKFRPSKAIATEQCDEGNPTTKQVTDSATCNGNNNDSNGPGSCRAPACGDSYTNKQFTPPGASATEVCDTGSDAPSCNGNNSGNNGPGSCQTPSCGDGYVNKMSIPDNGLGGATLTENCDNLGGGDISACNGNSGSTNGPGSCRTPACGDGYVNKTFTPRNGATKAENCDNLGGVDTPGCNGNKNGNDGPGSCQPPSCGDGYVNGMFTPPSGATNPENCDNVGGGNTATCNGNNGGNNGIGSCRLSACGDGYVNSAAGEECDKGNSGMGIPKIDCVTASKNCNSSCHCP